MKENRVHNYNQGRLLWERCVHAVPMSPPPLLKASSLNYLSNTHNYVPPCTTRIFPPGDIGPFDFTEILKTPLMESPTDREPTHPVMHRTNVGSQCKHDWLMHVWTHALSTATSEAISHFKVLDNQLMGTSSSHLDKLHECFNILSPVHLLITI